LIKRRIVRAGGLAWGSLPFVVAKVKPFFYLCNEYSLNNIKGKRRGRWKGR
jgi:hypothetical protein